MKKIITLISILFFTVSCFNEYSENVNNNNIPEIPDSGLKKIHTYANDIQVVTSMNFAGEGITQTTTIDALSEYDIDGNASINSTVESTFGEFSGGGLPTAISTTITSEAANLTPTIPFSILTEFSTNTSFEGQDISQTSTAETSYEFETNGLIQQIIVQETSNGVSSTTTNTFEHNGNTTNSSINSPLSNGNGEYTTLSQFNFDDSGLLSNGEYRYADAEDTYTFEITRDGQTPTTMKFFYNNMLRATVNLTYDQAINPIYFGFIENPNVLRSAQIINLSTSLSEPSEIANEQIVDSNINQLVSIFIDSQKHLSENNLLSVENNGEITQSHEYTYDADNYPTQISSNNVPNNFDIPDFPLPGVEVFDVEATNTTTLTYYE